MLQFNSNRSGSFLFFLVFLLTAGCAQQQTIQYSKSNRPYSISSTTKYKHQSPSQSEQAEYATVWEHLFDLYALPDIDNKRVEHEMNRYLKYPSYLSTIQERAEPYLYAIVAEIEAKNLPGELALLPVVESAFKADAYSRSDAAGLWQFIPSTGRFFGLKQNSWYDGRRDIHASTRVATNYLKELNETFDGDWMLALASYNAGKGTVSKAMAKNKSRNKPTDYWSLSLAQETKDYVPRLLAVAKIFANADKYNIPLRPIPDKKVYETVDVGSQLDLTIAAELADIPMSDFLTLNTGFKRWCTAPDGPHRLLIPVDQVDTFKQNLARLPKQERMKTVAAANNRHRVQKGETLNLIAKRYGVSVNLIRQANKLNGSNIIAGNTLLIPASANATDKFLRGKKQGSPRSHTTYVVKNGDNLWGIARKFSVSTQNIAKWNRIAVNNTLRPGQKLIIRKTGQAGIELASASYNPFRTVNYTVKKGDSLSFISRKFNVLLDDLRKWNRIDSGQHLQPGQRLKVLVSVNTPPTT